MPRTLALLVAALAATLAAAAPASAQQRDGLLGAKWRPLALDEQPPPDGVEAWLLFGADGRLTGYGGCNALSASWRVEGARIDIGPVAATRKTCPEPETRTEAAMLKALAAARSWEMLGADLVLRDVAGDAIAWFAQVPKR